MTDKPLTIDMEPNPDTHVCRNDWYEPLQDQLGEPLQVGGMILGPFPDHKWFDNLPSLGRIATEISKKFEIIHSIEILLPSTDISVVAPINGIQTKSSLVVYSLVKGLSMHYSKMIVTTNRQGLDFYLKIQVGA